MCTAKSIFVQLNPSLYSWIHLCTVESIFVQLNPSLYSWIHLCTAESIFVQLNPSLYSWIHLRTAWRLNWFLWPIEISFDSVIFLSILVFNHHSIEQYVLFAVWLRLKLLVFLWGVSKISVTLLLSGSQICSWCTDMIHGWGVSVQSSLVLSMINQRPVTQYQKIYKSNVPQKKLLAQF